ncbi:MAG: hypothetical protein KDB00_15370 [Planctomycetales bacterium]|nr:hypothetical protein [Planctomycetales bacterium]
MRGSWFLGLALLFAAGCSRDANQPAVVPAETSTIETAVETIAVPDSVPEPDIHFMLDRLRDVVSRDGLAEWNVAPSPMTWSTFTVDVGESLSSESTDLVWRSWSQRPTAITTKSNRTVREKVSEAVQQAIANGKNKNAEVEFDDNGFHFVVTAQNGSSADTTFVRISFIGTAFK